MGAGRPASPSEKSANSEAVLLGSMFFTAQRSIMKTALYEWTE